MKKSNPAQSRPRPAVVPVIAEPDPQSVDFQTWGEAHKRQESQRLAAETPRQRLESRIFGHRFRRPCADDSIEEIRRWNEEEEALQKLLAMTPAEPRAPGDAPAAAPSGPQAVSEPKAAEPDPAVTAGRGVAPRNEWFLTQYETRGDTYHKPSKICAKWNALKLPEREAICPDGPKTVLRDAVDKGIKRAREARDGKPSKPPQTARKA